MRLKYFCLFFVVWLPFWSHAQTNLANAEYFFDTDPGIGNGIPLPAFAAAGNIDVTFTATASGLTSGMHILGIRVRDVSNTWSIPSYSTVYVINNDPLAQGTITEAEYFFDSDPGVGNGTSIPGISSGTLIDVTYLANSSGLPVGMHILGVRTKDNAGLWSVPAFSAFYVDLNRSISKLEYYIDTDPGVGNAIPIAISPEQPSIDMDVVFSTAALSVGSHIIGVRVGRIDDNWSTTATSTFMICTYATADFTTNTACAGSPTTFTDNSSNTLPGDLYLWDFDSNGTTDATTVGNASFSYPSSGSYTATLTINRSGCTDVVTVAVQVETAPVAQAGNDQNLCVNNATLAANVPAAGETGVWTLISGSGTINNPADPASALNNIASFSNTLQWTVTNTIAGCSSSDQVIVISNQPITAPLLNNTVALGQTLNTDVQSGADTNPGDVLTTTIASSPKKGGAVVQTNGTISYTPNSGTVGKDTIVYQLCNQCLRCSANNLIVTIQNNAPVISPAPITAVNGQNVNVNLLTIISDPNNNLDPATLSISQQPISGAVASIDGSYNLIVDYTGIVFSGTDQLTITVCDFESVCSSNILSIEVEIPGDPPITVYNAISPNGDNKHDFLEIENITAYQNNYVYIFNRWGNKVFEAYNYDNDRKKFTGTSNTGGTKDLPGGTYFYSIHLGKSGSPITGFLVLKR